MALMSALITDLRSHLDETTARQWSDVELTRWLNEGLRDIARRAEVLQTTTNVTAVAGTQEYTLNTSTLTAMTRIYRVEFIPTGTTDHYPLEYRDFNSMDSVWWTQQETQSGYPYWFTLLGFPPALKMIVYPTPSTGGTLKVFYYRTPADAASGDTVSIPEGWQDLAVLYAEYVALRKDGDTRWQEAKQLYEERLGGLIDMTRRWSDQSDSFQTGTSFVPRWLYDPGGW
jgi:hypothetical protein